ncbi:hypothetical protein OROMI_025264 [Orobanche minor]
MDTHNSFPHELYVTYGDDEFEFEYDDDVFYCELRKQVLQLTAEEDEDNENAVFCYEKNKISDMVVAAQQGLNNGIHERVYYNWKPKELGRRGNGTGVFIPQITPTPIKYKPRRKKGKKGRTQEKIEKV